MQKARPIRQLAGTVTEVDADGNETHHAMAWNILPPPGRCCQICAREHDAKDPHDALSLYYCTTFNAQLGRVPTWADAVAHCDAATQAAWKVALTERAAWSEPPDGERPIAHHGV